MEKDLFVIPRNTKYDDNPIYGVLLLEDLNSQYLDKGSGAYHLGGNGKIEPYKLYV